MIFDKKYEDRLANWHDFRNTLEVADDPLQMVIDLYNQVPLISIHTDPWDPNMWPNPWELINENEYCDFCKLLGMCYTLQLTDRFIGANFEIHIGVDTDKSDTYYLLFVDDRVLNYDKDTHIARAELPKSFQSQTQYPMPCLQ